jgi:uncharacterized PurR-regulated membrane protein YhhQ (DUF165 family)
MTAPRAATAAALTAAYAGTIVTANWAVAHVAPIPVGFGQHAPAGILFAGLAFTCRDAIQEAAGRSWTLAAIAAGTVLSILLAGPGLAFASAAAFAISELADMAVYTPLRTRRHATAALGLSNTVGAAIDSVLFLSLAFGSLTYFWGQMLGKTYMTVPFVAAVALHHHRRKVVAA